ncbi:MAG: hypothetical protein LE168_00400 [Endomicrobium sp.]|nr:hypothetical protein [Endomicrobium sp.]
MFVSKLSFIIDPQKTRLFSYKFCAFNVIADDKNNIDTYRSVNYGRIFFILKKSFYKKEKDYDYPKKWYIHSAPMEK